MSSSLALGLLSVGIYGYSAYFIHHNPNSQNIHDITPAPLRPYGHLKFLTYQCLWIQLINAILHVVAHFVSPLKKLRDVWFTSLAYPTGSIVVYSFWGVWVTMGRELIFPTILSQYYPDWLNHATHTVMVPINFLMMALTYHKYHRNMFIVQLVFYITYTTTLFYIKFNSGMFVYPFLETMRPLSLAIYFLCSFLTSYLLFKSGNLLNNILHPTKSSASSSLAPRKMKQK